VILDLIFRKLLKNFYDLFFFNKHLDITNVILRQDHVEKTYEILTKKIKYTEHNEDAFSFKGEDESEKK